MPGTWETNMTKPIMIDWKEENASRFGKATQLMQHRLRDTGLFSRETLADLVDSIPGHCYNLNTMGWDPSNPVWREGAGRLREDTLVDSRFLLTYPAA